MFFFIVHSIDSIKDGQCDAASFHCNNELIVKHPTMGADRQRKNVSLEPGQGYLIHLLNPKY